MNMSSPLPIKFVIAVVISFPLFINCVSVNYDESVNYLVREANSLIEQEADIGKEFRNEFVSVFTEENRDKFPSNRETLRPHAENQLRLLQKQKSLLSTAIEKLEHASRISANDKEKRFTSLMADSLRKDIEIANYFVETMNLILDEKVTDTQTLKNKFVQTGQNAELKVKERDALQNEAKRIIGKE
jgi:hypothetical protein